MLWNTPPQPSAEILEALMPVYQAYAPELVQPKLKSHQQNLAMFGKEIIDSGYYQDLIAEEIICQVNYTVDDYLTLLTTLSPYIKLESSPRNILLGELRKVLLQYGDHLQLSYLSMLQIATKGS